MYLNDETKKSLSSIIGMPYESIIQMDEDEMQRHVEKKRGKKVSWAKGIKVDGLPIRTLESVEQKMDKICRRQGDDFER